MEEKRYKELMDKVGMPNSSVLKITLEQAVNETEQAMQAEIDGLIRENIQLANKVVLIETMQAEVDELKLKITATENTLQQYAKYANKKAMLRDIKLIGKAQE